MIYKKYWLNRFLLAAALLVLPIAGIQAIAFEAYTDNTSGIKVFDANGYLVDNTEAVNEFAQGWIIQTRGSEIELTLDMGAIKLGPQSLLSLDSFSDRYIDLYLLRGQIRVISDKPQTQITLATSNASYSFSDGDIILISEEEQLFYTNEGTAEVMNLVSGETFNAGKLEKVAVDGGLTTITRAESQVAAATKNLPINHYARPVLTAEAQPEPQIEQTPIPEPAEPEIAEPQPEPEPVPAEPEPEAVEPEPEPEPEPVPEPTPEPPIEVIEPVEPQPQPAVTAEEPEIPEVIELEAAEEPEVIETEEPQQRPGVRKSASLLLTGGIMHDLLPSFSADRPYIITRVSPVFSIGEIEIGLRLHAAFNGNPLDLSTWHTPRGNLLWNYGGGKSGFEKIQDITTDALSLIDHISIGDADSSFYLRADDTSSIDFGLGMRAGGLQTSIDHPSIRRTGLYNRFDTKFFDYELFVDDISYARLFGLRLAASPIPETYDFTLGFYGLADIKTMPTQMLLIPGIDLQLPIVPGVSVIGDISGLMYYNYNSETSFVYDATYNETGFHHFQAAGGLSGEFGSFSIKALANYRRGDLPFNLFGADYPHRRDALLDDFDNGDISADGDHLDIYGRIGMESGQLTSYFSYLIPMNVPSYAIDFSEDLLQAGFSFEAGSFTLGADALRRDVTGLLEDPSAFMDRNTMLSASLSYRIGRLTAEARYSHVFDDANQTSADPLLTIETTIELASLRDAGTGSTVSDHLFKTEERGITEDASDLDRPEEKVFSLELGGGAVASLSDSDFDGPFTRAGAYPRFVFGPVSLGLQFDVLTNGNPLTSRFEEEGEDKWDVLSLIGHNDFFSIKELATDVLSFIDYLYIGSPDHAYYLRADDSSSITFGAGTMIRDLRSDIDAPFIDRTGLYSRLETSILTHELMINDLSDPGLMASRFAFRPTAKTYPFEIGFSTIMDLTFEPGGNSATRMLLVPGIDMNFPLAFTDETTISLFADANFLAVYDRGVFEADSFRDFSNPSWFDRLYNYNGSAGIRYQDAQWEASAFFTFQKGRLESNMFGLDYAWRWEQDVYPLLDGFDSGNLTSRYNLTATASYTHNRFELDVLYSMRRNASFGFDSVGVTEARNAPDIIGVNLGYQFDHLRASFGMTKRGFTTFLRAASIPFFDGGSVLAHAQGVYETEHAAFSAALSIAKDYTADVWAPVLTLDTRIGVF
jgi:hypothetical protein